MRVDCSGLGSLGDDLFSGDWSQVTAPPDVSNVADNYGYGFDYGAQAALAAQSYADNAVPVQGDYGFDYGMQAALAQQSPAPASSADNNEWNWGDISKSVASLFSTAGNIYTQNQQSETQIALAQAQAQAKNPTAAQLLAARYPTGALPDMFATTAGANLTSYFLIGGAALLAIFLMKD